MSAPTDPTKERSQHEDDVLERIAKIVGADVVPAGEHYVGDDAAVLKPFVGEAIISTDVAVLGVHLDSELFSLRDLEAAVFLIVIPTIIMTNRSDC